MKAHVLFDDDGVVGAMSHPDRGIPGKPAGQGGFLPAPGQHTAHLEVPAELAHLKPRDLHAAVRVALENGTHRLVAR